MYINKDPQWISFSLTETTKNTRPNPAETQRKHLQTHLVHCRMHPGHYGDRESMKRKQPYIITDLAELDPQTLLDLRALCTIFQKCESAIRGAISRGELPPAIRFCSVPVWTAGSIMNHFQQRQMEAIRESKPKPKESRA